MRATMQMQSEAATTALAAMESVIKRLSSQLEDMDIKVANAEAEAASLRTLHDPAEIADDLCEEEKKFTETLIRQLSNRVLQLVDEVDKGKNEEEEFQNIALDDLDEEVARLESRIAYMVFLCSFDLSLRMEPSRDCIDKNALQGARSASRNFEEQPNSVSPSKWIPSELEAKRDPVRFFNAIRQAWLICCKSIDKVSPSALINGDHICRLRPPGTQKTTALCTIIQAAGWRE